jgi:hypothetical protein
VHPAAKKTFAENHLYFFLPEKEKDFMGKKW